MKKLLALLIALSMVFSLSVCAFADEAESADVKEVNIGWYGTNNLINPFDPCMLYGFNICGSTETILIYDQLFYYTNEGTCKSLILDDYYFEDETTLVMKLKDNIYFSNGEQLTGEDVIFTYQKTMEGFFPIKFMYAFEDWANASLSEDKLTITLPLLSPTPYATSFLNVGILCKSYIESMGGGENIDWYDPSQIVGSGPYKVTEYTQDSTVTYELRDDYWGFDNEDFNINADIIHAKLYNDSTSLMSDYQNGIIDLAWNVTKDDYDAAANGDMADTGYGMVTNNFVSWLFLDIDGEYTSDPAVREAICHAIDVETIEKTVLGSLGVTGKGLFAEHMLAFTDEYHYEYDPAYAQQVLTDAGYNFGDITILYSYKIADPVQSQTAELVQAYLMAVGINVEMNGLDESTYSSEETVQGYSDIAYYYMSNGANDPGQFMGNLTSHGSNQVIFRGDKYDEIINKGNTSFDEAERIAAYQELQKQMFENFDCVPLFELGTGYLYNTEVFESCTLVNISGLMIFDFVVK